jgi:D-glycero-alpha-D-manno-heptose-7-phosphate kinase
MSGRLRTHRFPPRDQQSVEKKTCLGTPRPTATEATRQQRNQKKYSAHLGDRPIVVSEAHNRVSYAGGGSDLPAFYRHEAEGGAVLSTTVSLAFRVVVARHMEPTIHVRAADRIEIAERLDEVSHGLVRECLRQAGIERNIQVSIRGNIQPGTGLGSSGTVTVALLKAMHSYCGKSIQPAELARQACRIEMDILGQPVGLQDQYAAAFGGFNLFQFNKDEEVKVTPVKCRPEVLAELEAHTLLLNTGRTRNSSEILGKQAQGTGERMGELRQMRALAFDMFNDLDKGDLDRFADHLHRGWELKRSLGFGISNEQIDEWYKAARDAGCQGGKLLGAGGGGFLLLMAPPARHEAILEALGGLRKVPFALSPDRSQILF